MNTCSVSKGCFVFKPSAKKRRLSQRTADYFGNRSGNSEDSELRFLTCQSLWNQIKSETEKVQEDLNKQLLDNLVSFLSRSHSEFQEKTTEWTCRMKFREIPTAALVLGVNVTDHDLTFRSLSDFLQNNITPYIALVEAKDCPGIKNLMQKLMGQLMNCYVDVDSLEEEDYVQVSQNRTRCSMSSLIKWYKSVTKLLLTDQFPFKLGEKVLQVLINIFLYHDFSVQNFIKGFQLCIVEHFFSQPLSVLCCQLVDLKERVTSLSHNQCENIRRLPSFRRYVEKQESGKQIALLTTDNFLKIRDLHCACLENQVWETKEYESSLQLARMLNKSDLVTMLQQCVEILLSSSGKEFDKTVEKLKEFLTQFQNLEDVKCDSLSVLATVSNQALKCDGGSISNKAPDICIVYKLHLECGRLINLVDWLEAFSTVVTAAEEPNADTASSDQVDDIIQQNSIDAP
ncbi:hypothetical protein WISP_40566 [Willisornis vidua]|uniref:Origin recognition complex subunit 3 n=1 Tax=Willisornis vidua TaxID=1566151 RepID=A0ABQ9DH75_9PASS|nr:hypothetical protein WISP_40566 [Willisornis vidua]